MQVYWIVHNVVKNRYGDGVGVEGWCDISTDKDSIKEEKYQNSSFRFWRDESHYCVGDKINIANPGQGWVDPGRKPFWFQTEIFDFNQLDQIAWEFAQVNGNHCPTLASLKAHLNNRGYSQFASLIDRVEPEIIMPLVNTYIQLGYGGI